MYALRSLALIALIVCEDRDTILHWFVEVRVVWVSQLLIVVSAFSFEPLYNFTLRLVNA